MPKPVIMVVDDDPAVLRAITRDLGSHFGQEFQVVSMPSCPPALKRLAEYALRDRPVAMIVSDQRMPVMTGIELLERAKREAPEAKLVLLTAYADTDVAIKAINDINLDRYLMKPWDPPEEKLYPILDDLLDDWRRNHPDDRDRVRIVGHRWSERSHELKTFLARNYVPYRWLDLERDDEAHRLHDLAHALPADLPLVLVADGEPLRSPSTLDVAGALGLRTTAEKPLYDLCIVGGGPAGLAAAVYGASEGLEVVIVESHAPGGQAGQSAAIENYLGFPNGLTGADLAARAMDQAKRFGAEMVLAREVVGFDSRGPVRAVRFSDGTEIEARALLIASGCSYQLLDAAGLGGLTGRGVYYGASASQASACVGDDVYVVGAANSAGQAVLNLARFARRVVLVVRGDALEKAMSRYLVERIRATDNVEVRLQTEVTAGSGEDHLEGLTLADHGAGTNGRRRDQLAVRVHRSDTAHRVARGRRRARREGLCDDRSRSARQERAPALAPRQGPVHARDERARRLRRRGRSVRLDEASCVRGRRRRHVRASGPPLPDDDLMKADDLREGFLFKSFTDDQLNELLAVGDEIAFEEGEELFKEGDPADFWWVLLDGQVSMVRRAGREQAVVMMTMDRPGQWAGGFQAWADASYLATGRGAVPGRMFRVPAKELGRLANEWTPFGVHMIQGFFQTVRVMDTLSREREQLIKLGEQSARLAHEINNPASAMARSVDALSETCDTLLSSLVQLNERELSADRFVAIDALRREIDPSSADRDPLALADAEETLSDWLTAHDVESGWRIAPPLAAAGVDTAWCDRGGSGARARHPRARARVGGKHAREPGVARGDEGIDLAHLRAHRRSEVVLADGPADTADHRCHRGNREHRCDAAEQARHRHHRRA